VFERSFIYHYEFLIKVLSLWTNAHRRWLLSGVGFMYTHYIFRSTRNSKQFTLQPWQPINKGGWRKPSREHHPAKPTRVRIHWCPYVRSFVRPSRQYLRHFLTFWAEIWHTRSSIPNLEILGTVFRIRPPFFFYTQNRFFHFSIQISLSGAKTVFEWSEVVVHLEKVWPIPIT
jgi:hypothetical protein